MPSLLVSASKLTYDVTPIKTRHFLELDHLTLIYVTNKEEPQETRGSRWEGTPQPGSPGTDPLDLSAPHKAEGRRVAALGSVLSQGQWVRVEETKRPVLVCSRVSAMGET